MPATWSSLSGQLGEGVEGVGHRLGRPGPFSTQGEAPNPQVVAHGEAREGHLSPHQQGHVEPDDLFGLEEGRVDPVEPDDTAVGVLEPGDGAQQGGLAGAVRPEQGHDLPLGDLEVDAEQDLVGAVVEVEVVDLQGGQVAAGRPPLALGVALEDVLDDHGDVPAHVTRPEGEEDPAGHAHRGDEGEGDDDAMQATDGVGDGAEDDAAGEAAEDE